MVRRILWSILLAVSPLGAVAQNTIKGKVTDAGTGEPLIGVTILMKEENTTGLLIIYNLFSKMTNRYLAI